MSDVLFIDFETYSDSNIRDTGAFKYAADPSTGVHCLAWAFNDESVASDIGLTQRVLDHIESGGIVIAHNAAFEKAILKHVYGLVANVRCTSAVAAYNAIPASLEGAANTLGLDTKKDKEGAKVMRRYLKAPIPREAIDDIETMQSYCRTDVEVTRQIHQKLGNLPERELQIWLLDQKMNEIGIEVDLELAAIVIKQVEEAKKLLNDEIAMATDGAVEKPTQAKRIINWLAERGVETDNLQAGTVATLLEQTDCPTVQQVLICRQNGAGVATGKYTKALHMAGRGNRVRGNLRYHAATTGRWAGSGLQIQNLPRGTVSDTDTLAELFLAGKNVDEMAGDVFKAAKSAVRPMIRARKNDSFIVVDYASIEARVLAWLAGEDKLIADFRSGADIYCSFASEVFGEVVTKADKKKRMVGKVGILGLGYGMGAPKFQATLKDWAGMDVDLKFAQKVVDRYRNTYAGIQQFWYDLNDSGVACMLSKSEDETRWHRESSALCYTLPSGRVIRYQSPRLIEGKFGSPAIKYQRPLGKQMVWSDTYGGKLTENVTQAVARDIMADAMLRLDEMGYRILASVHDEIIIEHPTESADSQLKVVCHVMRQNAVWSVGCPLDVEGFVTKRYKK